VSDADLPGPDPAPPLRTATISVRRTARYVTAGVAAADASDLWYGLHGYGQLAADFAPPLLPVLGPTTRLVVPEALSRFDRREERGTVGASWMTREARTGDIADYVAYLDDLHATEGAEFRGRVHVLGFSQGSATACRWAVLGNVAVQTLVLWAGDVPPDLDWDRARRALSRTRVIRVSGTGDPYLARDRVEADAALLASHGIQSEVLWFDGGHHLKSALLREIAAQA